MAVSRRDHLLNTALTLFYEHGYHATGVDRIIEVSGVTKATLYNHFKSKDELLLAALRRRDESFRNQLMKRCGKKGLSPRARLLAVFDVLQDFIHQRDFFGCMFINAAGEFSNHEHPIHAAAAEHKRLMTNYLVGLAADAGVAEPGRLADQLMILFDGAIVTAQVSGPRDSVVHAREMAESAIERAVA